MKTAILAFALTISLTTSPKTSEPTPQETAFIDAAKIGDLEQLKKGINSPLDINARDKNGMTALMYAAEKNHPEAVKVLINSGADIEACHYRATALVYAVWNSNAACVKALLSAGTSTGICLRFHGDLSILDCAKDPEILSMLIAAGAPINAQDSAGNTTLASAIDNRNFTFVTILLSAGANPDIVDYRHLTPLMAAAKSGFTEGAKALITAGANKNLKDKDGKTALDYAATEEIKALLLGN